MLIDGICICVKYTDRNICKKQGNACCRQNSIHRQNVFWNFETNNRVCSSNTMYLIGMLLNIKMATLSYFNIHHYFKFLRMDGIVFAILFGSVKV